ncbi:MAG: hypothetical protein ACXACO_13420 [Promethearchaeota archaeon]|jgi:hypothetical protein
MAEREEKDFDEEFDENGFDPTKEAFFSDLMGMEEEIASEAYELVEHAMNLIETKFFDDAIEILRQAIGFYAQINREDEIKAINDKISEVYILKEKTFREQESKVQLEKDLVPEEELEVIETLESTLIEAEPDDSQVDSSIEVEQLISEGKQLLENNNFEEALDHFDKAVEIFEEVDNSEGVDRVFTLIEECYNKKAEFLQSVKRAPPPVEEQLIGEQETPFDEETLKEEKLKQFLISKKREEEISSQAYELLGKATELGKIKQYDQAIELYKEGGKLFQQLNWTYEVEKVQDTIAQIEKEKQDFEKVREERETEVEEGIKISEQEEKITEQQITAQKEQDRLAQLEKLRGIELQKMDYEFFKAQIDNMVTEASRLAREYELAMQKAIKKGELVEECIYPKVIEIYKQVKELLIDKGWGNEATIYNDTIDVYIQKFEQDKKIRQIEIEKEKQDFEKVREEKETEVKEGIKISEQEEIITEQQITAQKDQDRLAQLEKLRGIELQKMENEFFKAQIDNMITEASRLAREYELAMQKAIKKGELVEECIYPKVIDIYKQIKELLIDKGWGNEAAIYNDTIDVYIQKFEQDKKIRQIELEKVKKQTETEELLKSRKDEEVPILSKEELQRQEEQRQKEIEVQNFKAKIEEMTNRAERLAREYEVALRKGKFTLKCPYPEIIDIYQSARLLSAEKGWETDVGIYSSHVQAYTEKLEKDKRLRRIEAEKIQKQKEAEDLLKFQKEVSLDEKKLKQVEEHKRIQEDEADFQEMINDMVNKAEKMAREYDMEMKKAIRQGKLAENPPFAEVIRIYERAKQIVLARGKNEEASVYNSQINFYTQKWEKDKVLHEVEEKKLQKQKEIEDMHRVVRKVGVKEETSKIVERKKEEEEFEKHISEMVNQAEKRVRDYEMAMRKAMRKGEFLENTPYIEAIEIYKQIKSEVDARGWKDQGEIYLNQINIYQDKLDKNEKLRQVEEDKTQHQKEIEEVSKEEKSIEFDQKKVKKLEEKRKEEEFEKFIADMVTKAEKLEREYDLALKKALKKGEFIEQTPYPEIIDIYIKIKKSLIEKGWGEQAQIYTNQIKICEEKLIKSEKLRKVEAEKAKRQKEIDDMHKRGTVAKVDQKKLLNDDKKQEEKEFQKYINDMINKAEKLEREYDSAMKKALKKGEFIEQTPYLEIIDIFSNLKTSLIEKGWGEQAQIYTNQIKIFEEKLKKSERLHQVEAEKAQTATKRNR